METKNKSSHSEKRAKKKTQQKSKIQQWGHGSLVDPGNFLVAGGSRLSGELTALSKRSQSMKPAVCQACGQKQRWKCLECSVPMCFVAENENVSLSDMTAAFLDCVTKIPSKCQARHKKVSNILHTKRSCCTNSTFSK